MAKRGQLHMLIISYIVWALRKSKLNLSCRKNFEKVNLAQLRVQLTLKPSKSLNNFSFLMQLKSVFNFNIRRWFNLVKFTLPCLFSKIFMDSLFFSVFTKKNFTTVIPYKLFNACTTSWSPKIFNTVHNSFAAGDTFCAQIFCCGRYR